MLERDKGHFRRRVVSLGAGGGGVDEVRDGSSVAAGTGDVYRLIAARARKVAEPLPEMPVCKRRCRAERRDKEGM